MHDADYADGRRVVTFDDGTTLDVVPYNFDAPHRSAPRSEDAGELCAVLHNALVGLVAEAGRGVTLTRAAELADTIDAFARRYDEARAGLGLPAVAAVFDDLVSDLRRVPRRACERRMRGIATTSSPRR